MAETVERVARALWACEVKRRGYSPRTDTFDDLPDDFKDGYRGLAHAAIEAMREPTSEMAEAAAYPSEAGTGVGGLSWMEAASAWTAMIDAALAEPTGT